MHVISSRKHHVVIDSALSVLQVVLIRHVGRLFFAINLTDLPIGLLKEVVVLFLKSCALETVLITSQQPCFCLRPHPILPCTNNSAGTFTWRMA